ncbi:MAG: hypothetical protein AB7Q23_10120 [Hyphomonadaceae bacterium]
MGRVVRTIGVVVVASVILLTGAFFSAGGWQIVTTLRGPTLPDAPVALTPAGDLTYLRAAVIANERGATDEQFAAFTSLLDESRPPDTVDDLTLVASRALASFDNAHTTLVRPVMHRLPIRLHWTADALIVVKSRPEYAALLGRRIVSLGGRTPEEMLASMPLLVGGGTASWRRYRSEYFLSAPAALAFLGADLRDGTIELRTVDAAGEEETTVLVADADPLPGDAFWDFLDAFPGDTHFQTDGWLTLLHRDQELPIYLQEGDKLFLLRPLPDHRAVYVRLNGSVNDDTETLAAFTRRVLAEVSQGEPSNIIVDFRYNRGGDYTMVLPLVEGLSRALPVNGRLYLIVGPNTFSAGLLAGSQFKRFLGGRLTVVGEEVGDRLRFRGEGVMVTLPATNVEVNLATAWDDVAADCGWFGDCWPLNKVLLRGVGSLDPDLRVSNTWESYREGRDLVVEAVFADISRRGGR